MNRLYRIVLVLLLMISTSVSASSYAPIVNRYVEDRISRQEVYWIYTLKTRFWYDGSKITVFYMDFDSMHHRRFVIDVLRTSPYKFRASVDTYINIGNAAYFRKVSSEKEMWQRVSMTPGAVGYISETVLIMNDSRHGAKKLYIFD